MTTAHTPVPVGTARAVVDSLGAGWAGGGGPVNVSGAVGMAASAVEASGGGANGAGAPSVEASTLALAPTERALPADEGVGEVAHPPASATVVMRTKPARPQRRPEIEASTPRNTGREL